jgi:hypothetical protein
MLFIPQGWPDALHTKHLRSLLPFLSFESFVESLNPIMLRSSAESPKMSVVAFDLYRYQLLLIVLAKYVGHYEA